MIEMLFSGLVLPGLVAATAVGAMCGSLGVLQALRGSALAGDSLAHAALPGVCAAWLVSGSSHPAVLLTGAMIAGLAAGAWSAAIRTSPASRPDAAIAIPLVSAFGLGALLFTVAQRQPGSAAAGLGGFLFGNAAAVDPTQAAIVAATAAVTVGALAMGWRVLGTALLDPVWAASVGVPARRVQIALDVILALLVVLSIRSVGVLLVAAMLVVPAAAAMQVAQRLPRTMLLAAAMGALSGVAGVAASVALPGVATGPAMALSAAVLLGLSIAARQLRAVSA